MQRSDEGYLLIDHRESPGVADELAVAAGLPVGAGKGLFESATCTCSHCQAIVVLNPRRTRERARCTRCNHYLCDGCGAELARTGVCYPWKRRVDEILNRTATGTLIIS